MALWVAIALVSALLFGASTPLSKLLLEQVSPFQLAGLLYLGAALGVSPFAVRRRVVQRVARLDRANLVRLVGAVVLGGIAGPVLLLLGLRWAAAASVSLWLNLELVATAVLGVVLFRDQLTGRAWVGAAVVVGAALLLSGEEQSAGLLPGLLVALACVCWGFDNHFTSLIDGLTPQETTLWKGLAAGATNLAIGLGVSSWDAAPGTAVAALGLGALSYGASIVLYIAAAQNIGATRGQLVFSAAPFFGVPALRGGAWRAVRPHPDRGCRAPRARPVGADARRSRAPPPPSGSGARALAPPPRRPPRASASRTARLDRPRASASP